VVLIKFICLFVFYFILTTTQRFQSTVITFFFNFVTSPPSKVEGHGNRKEKQPGESNIPLPFIFDSFQKTIFKLITTKSFQIFAGTPAV